MAGMTTKPIFSQSYVADTYHKYLEPFPGYHNPDETKGVANDDSFK